MKKTILTCAVTGSLTRPDMNPNLPVTPKQIADSALGAADAGAAIVHIHVRDPQTGKPSMELDHYAEVMQLIKAQNKEVVINLTTGPGARFIPTPEDPKIFAPGTSLCNPLKRVEHITKLQPDICSLDLNAMNTVTEVALNTPHSIRTMAKIIREAGVLPEIEIFNQGDLTLAKDLIKDGTLEGPGYYTFVMGVKYAMDTHPSTLMYMQSILPQGATWAAFGISSAEFPIVAQSWLLGGHVRVGMEDNIYMSRGVLCESNAQLVSRAKRIIDELGGELASPAEARVILGLKKIM